MLKKKKNEEYRLNINITFLCSVLEGSSNSLEMSMRSVSETAAAACIVVLSTLVILVVLGNILVCVIIMKHRDMQ